MEINWDKVTCRVPWMSQRNIMKMVNFVRVKREKRKLVVTIIITESFHYTFSYKEIYFEGILSSYNRLMHFYCGSFLTFKLELVNVNSEHQAHSLQNIYIIRQMLTATTGCDDNHYFWTSTFWLQTRDMKIHPQNDEIMTNATKSIGTETQTVLNVCFAFMPLFGAT